MMLSSNSPLLAKFGVLPQNSAFSLQWFIEWPNLSTNLEGFDRESKHNHIFLNLTLFAFTVYHYTVEILGRIFINFCFTSFCKQWHFGRRQRSFLY